MKTGLTADEQGLAKAMRLALEPNERELAEESFSELVKRLLGRDTMSVKVPSPAPEPTPQVVEQKDIFAAIIEGMRITAASPQSKRTSELQAWLGDTELPAKNWRDINAGLVEAMILLNRKDFVVSRGYVSPNDQRAKADGSLYPKHAYRKLSDGSFLFLHSSANSHIQRSRGMLRELGVALKTLHVAYRNETFDLP